MVRQKHILCFGDSNTWGFEPVVGSRYDDNTRWPCVVQKLLGDEFRIIEAGLCGRTTVFDSPYDPFKNGEKALGYAMSQSSPVSLVVLMLGTNDLDFTDAHGAARGVASLVRAARIISTMGATSSIVNGVHLNRAPVKVLLISPILMHPEIGEENLAYRKSLEFDKHYKKVAEAFGCWYLNAADYAAPSPKDGVHLAPEGHLALAPVIADKIREIFETT